MITYTNTLVFLTLSKHIKNVRVDGLVISPDGLTATSMPSPKLAHRIHDKQNSSIFCKPLYPSSPKFCMLPEECYCCAPVDPLVQ
jgi:hypothetical protein